MDRSSARTAIALRRRNLALMSLVTSLVVIFSALRGFHSAPTTAQTTSPRAFLPLLIHRATPVPAITVRVTPTAAPTRGTSPTPGIAPASPTVPPDPRATETATVPPTVPPSPTVSPTPTTTAPPTPPVGAACGALPTFEDELEPDLEIHVATTGDDGEGDGSAGHPFRTLARAARMARPGAAIRLHAGSYAGGTFLENLQGSADAPIWLGGMPGEARPVLEGGGEGLHLVKPRWLVVHDLLVRNVQSNGLNADDGGDVADPLDAHHVIFRGLDIQGVGGTGNQDCLKLSGLSDVVVRDSRFSRCGGGGSGSGIDMVGVHRALVARSTFVDISGNAVQAKGGSADVEIRWNRMQNAGGRAVNMGGSTGFDFFRPPLVTDAENAEARRVRVVANVIRGSDTPWAFVGCVDCLSAHNTVIEPNIWLMRILQETNTQPPYSFAPARNGQVINNLFVFRRSQLRADVNVGGGTAPETFRFANNLWFARDNPGRSAPQLPVAETGGVVGQDPRIAEDGAIPPGSPAAGRGLGGDWSPGDIAGRCWAVPPSIGAWEVP
jgi:hypothetical protein